MDITILYYVLLGIGFLLLIVPPAIPSASKQKLGGTEYALQVFLPTTIGLAVFLLAYWGLYKDVYDEQFYQILIGITAAGAIALSLGAGFQSLTRMRWMSD
jgi:hypothetical protein